MAEMKPPVAGHRIEHKKAPNFIREPVESVNIGLMNSSDGGAKISLTFSRDEMDITHEVLVASAANPENLIPLVPTEALSTYRLEFANLTLSIATAKNLAAGLEQTLKGLEQIKSE